mgnify:CR=1 FL=1
MKISKLIFIGLIALTVVLNASILHQSMELKNKILCETSSRQRAEWCLFDGIKNVGNSIPLDSISYGHHFILRYDMTTCMPCLIEAEVLLENGFGKDRLMKELCLIGVDGCHTQFDGIISTTSYDSILSPMDGIYSPYFCYVSDNGDVLFSLTMQPENYDYNMGILFRLKDAITEQ